MRGGVDSEGTGGTFVGPGSAGSFRHPNRLNIGYLYTELFFGPCEPTADGFPHVFHGSPLPRAYRLNSVSACTPATQLPRGADRADRGTRTTSGRRLTTSCARLRKGHCGFLIVEDDDIVADQSPADCRPQLHYSVLGSNSAEGAAQAARARRIALAVIDVGLPGADGLTLVRRLAPTAHDDADPDSDRSAAAPSNDKVKALDLGPARTTFAASPSSPEFWGRALPVLCAPLDRCARWHHQLNRLSVDLAGKRLSIDGAKWN